MKKLLLSLSLLATSFGFSQVTVFQDSFDTYNDFLISGFGQWQTLDLDLLPTYTGGTVGDPTWANAGAPQAYQIFNPTTALVTNSNAGCSSTTENINFNPRTGAKFAACWAAVPSTTGGPTANNDWLVSPPINLTGATGSSLNFWVKSLSDCYGLEKYKIGVYIGSGNPIQSSDFTIISGLGNLTSSSWTAWTQRTQSLSAYDGQTIRIGIQCVSDDKYMFMIDDFTVTAATMSSSDFVASKLSVYPNPVNDIVNISNYGDLEINKIVFTDINGRTVKSLNLNGVSESQINISELNAGVYFMNIDTNEGSATKKIVKK
ncbi:T9SS type A sorting domain-containing protein [Flavobacterium enshiense]|uniref:T9SS-dependent choice-of-anchor J family protein n=1 Tax=Flavobacterium enshiense TaxID=1341165 RepID=UPI00345D8096